MNVSLAPGLDVSTKIFTTASAVIGIRGSGKTSTGVVLAENAIRCGVPVAIIDPTGAWYGLKSSADGRNAGLPVYIFGGEHGDVPLEAEAGPIVARFVVDERQPVILDVSDLSKGMQRRFVGQFCEALYDLKNRKRDPLLVIVDETPRFCPQQIRQGEVDLAKCVGAVEDIVALGRSRGLGCVIIGQRPATINKNVLTQCDNLFALRTVGPQDRKALDEWVTEAQGDQTQRDEMVANIPGLKTGEGYFWSPGIFGEFKRVKFNARTTFDSSRTPKVGEKRIEPRAFAAVDLEKLRGEIAGAVERAKADDPKALRARIAELERQLKARPAETVEKIVEVQVLDRNDVERLGTTAQSLQAFAEEQNRITERLIEALNRATARPEPKPVAAPTRPVERQVPPPRPVAPRSAGGESPTPACLRILHALMLLPNPIARGQVAFLADTSPTSSSFDNNLAWLNARGLIERHPDRALAITEAGRAIAGPPPIDAPRTSRDLIALFLPRLEPAKRRIMEALIAAWPRAIERSVLADRAGTSPTSSSYDNNLSALSSLGVLERIKDGGQRMMRASDLLFPTGAP